MNSSKSNVLKTIVKSVDKDHFKSIHVVKTSELITFDISKKIIIVRHDDEMLIVPKYYIFNSPYSLNLLNS